MYYAPAQDTQRPTHPRLRIRNVRDAQVVLEAVRLGLLQPVKRRLNENERSMFIRSGAVFVWEESDQEYGLRRWTDGRTWGQSRARDVFLFYEEKSPHWSHPIVSSSQVSSQRLSQYPTTYNAPRLVKQAYSAWIGDSDNNRRKKRHITAYFTLDDLDELPVPSEDPTLKNIVVPPEIYPNEGAGTRDSETSGDYDTQNLLPVLRPQGDYHHTSAGPARPTYYGGRIAEDQRLIHMLNSRHVN